MLRRTKIIWILVMISVLLMSTTACGDQNPEDGSSETHPSESASAELSQSDIDTLMKQVADREGTKRYEDYMPDEVFADADFFGIDQNEDERIAYVWLITQEYVALKEKAYCVGGSSGEAILRFKSTEDGPELIEVEYSADGNLHQKWIEENFSKESLENWKQYEAYDTEGRNVLETNLIKVVEETLGVPVETDNLLEIDTEEGTYEIIRTIESGEPGKDYTFDTETIEKGNLSDLAEQSN